MLESDPCAYSRALLSALKVQAGRQGRTVVPLGASWASSPSEPKHEEVEQSLELAESSGVDAIVLLSGVFGNGVLGLSRLAQRWAPRPIVSVGYRLAGVPSVLVDNRQAMKAAALHLIETHGCNRILFIRGRRDSKEGEDRYLGFRHALREKGILNDERRVITGDFTKPGVLNAYAKLGDVAFDAVLSANDDMALALMGELTKQGRAVPRDVAVIGFDDVPEARLASVPLTSVAQPFDDLAKSAIVALDKELSHTVASSVSAVHAQLVVRQSCGCQPAS